MSRVKKKIADLEDKIIRETYSLKGKSLSEIIELPLQELGVLLTARPRRKLLRGLTPLELVFYQKVLRKEYTKTRSRDMIVLPKMVGKKIGIYNGKNYIDVLLKPEMIGRYLGEFSRTRHLVKYQKKQKAAPGPKKK